MQMVELFQYTLVGSIAMVILWAAYRCSIATKKQPGTNRSILLGIYLISLVIGPVLSLKAVSTVSVMATGRIIYPAFTLTRWMETLSYIWLCGAIFIVFFTVIELARVYQVVKGAKRVSVDGKDIYVTGESGISPFSIGRVIVISQSDYQQSSAPIITHETGHIRYAHSWDMLIAQVAAIVFWYNPAVWLLRADLKSVHEFQADSYAISNGCEQKAYQLFLISRVAGSKFPRLGNNLNSSKLHQRIAMMNRPSKLRMRDRIGNIVPVVALLAALFVLNIPAVKATILPFKGTGTPEHKRLDMDIYMDGKEIPGNQLNEISPSQIKSITVHKNPDRIDISTKD